MSIDETLDEELISRARAFAEEKHRGQVRKGENAEPYIVHLDEVVEILREVARETDTVLVVAAYLHDTREDTDTTYEELCDIFGTEAADVVQEVTDDPRLSWQECWTLRVANAPRITQRAKKLTLADKISNMRSVLESPPTDWEDYRKPEYFEWVYEVARGCSGASLKLDNLFHETYLRGVDAFGASAHLWPPKPRYFPPIRWPERVL